MASRLSLANFKAQVSDFARPNRFFVEVYPPSFLLADIGNAEAEFVRLLAQTATIPSRTQGEVALKFHGMELKLPGDYTKEPLSITFLNDYGFIGRFMFEYWMESGIQSVNDQNQRPDGMATINDSTITIQQVGRTDSDILGTYKFYNVFPNNISAIELDMSQQDQIEKYTVTFSYSHFENMDMY